MKVCTRKDAASDPRYGVPPAQRSIQQLLQFGVIVIDKPPGPSSHQVSAYVKQILNVKTGHSGTLDPKVTGVLPVGLGRGTRLTNALLPAGKEYITLMHIHQEVEEYELRKVLAQFTGEISQLPPVKSAVKRQERKRTIYELEILDIQGQDVLFRAVTQAGTYIRKLCHDMGVALQLQGKPVGAHMVELRRSRAGPFTENGAVTLHELKDAMHYCKEGDESQLRRMVLPGEAAVEHLPKVWVLDSTVESLCQGIQLKLPGVAKYTDDIIAQGMVAVLTLKGEVVLIGESLLDATGYTAQEGVAVRTKQVLMPPGTYPRNVGK